MSQNLSPFGQPHAYDDPDLATLAAANATGIIRNHPFMDGNKHVGFMVAYVILSRNGINLTATEVSATHAVMDLAAGQMTEEQFCQWLRDNTEQARR